MLVRQQVQYEWKPIKCAHCLMYGHTEPDCRKKPKPRQEWRPIQRDRTPPLAADEEGFIPVTNRASSQPPPQAPVLPTASNPFANLTRMTLRWESTGGIYTLMDNVGCWNIRGLNWPNKQEDLRVFMQQKQIGLMGLLETKIKEKNVTHIANKLFPDWHWCHNFHLNPKGRIWVCWKPRVYHLQVLATTAQLLHCKVHHIESKKHFFLTFVYGFNHAAERVDLWSDLCSIANNMEEAWCVIGDFN
ncbi:hypothetical protein Cgig2_014343 [Carnegiea gigantea]|uniref:Endonuclease/exonuclease/phosphatase domain-containing protein n=1 Tax=Carnegiea gigantea TaxID=171969 RepID=A0A9Q1GHQ0_9CARY|nr:hypothetical protein Cgig2_014343 [Carnegiea gigantea]